MLLAAFITATIVLAGGLAYSNIGVAKSSFNPQSQAEQQSIVLGDAYAHWNYISIENASMLLPQYTSNATLHWIGGPLNGNYQGVQNITATWNKFFKAWSSVWFYTIVPPSSQVSGNVAQVTSENQFVLTPSSNQVQVQYINVSYILNYSFMGNEWKITSETWHIVGSGFVSYEQQTSEMNELTALAFSHWNNIAIENNTSVMQEYSPNANLHWINSTLNGYYNGTQNISSVWNKFFGLWNAVWFYAENPPIVSINGNYANVTATIQFVVQESANTSMYKYINVSYSISYMNMGFYPSTGHDNYEIVGEIFNVLGGSPQPLTKL